MLIDIPGFLLKEDEPHLKQTILPPKDLSETMEELPQLRQTLFSRIILIKNYLTHLNYILKNKCKEKIQNIS